MSPYSRRFSLQVRDLRCDRGGLPVFRGVSFSMESGEAVQLFGENGAGKSSLLGLLAGHVSPVEGEMVWSEGGADYTGHAPRSSTFFLGHEQGAKHALTVTENLGFWAGLYAKPIDLSAILSRIGLINYSNVPAARLSAGQRRRLDLTRLMIAERPIWLLDEPAASIDEKGSALLAELVNQHASRGGLAIVATHEKLPFSSTEMKLM